MAAIRPAASVDEDAIWEIFHEVVATGGTYVFDPATNRDEGLAYWLNPAYRCYVAEEDGRVVGTYILRDNQPGLGSHVANASFMVRGDARGRGIGRQMGEHALAEAKSLGYRAMQFNIVAATNENAIRLWQSLGFAIIGTLPEAFRHASQGYVDAHVMYRLI